jgi:hypothetical protein
LDIAQSANGIVERRSQTVVQSCSQPRQPIFKSSNLQIFKFSNPQILKLSPMKIELIVVNGTTLAEIISDEIVIIEPQDALDIMAEAGYMGSDKLIFHQKNIGSDFFDLKSRLAGEILQKFSNYRVQLAIVADLEKFTSKSMQDFIRESNKMGRVFFVTTVKEAIKKLAG